MDKDLKLSPVGLWTDPANVEAPTGGLLQANECVIRQKGQIEPRPGFGSEDLFTGNVTRLLDFGDDFLGVDAVTPTTRWGSDNTEVHTPSGADLTWLAYAIQGVEARKNLYITTSDGIRKLTDNGAAGAVAYPVGLPTVSLRVISDAAGTVVEDTFTVVYRAILKRTDANSVITLGGVSNPAQYINGQGSTQDPTVLVGLHQTAADSALGTFLPGDVVQIYRSLQQPGNLTPFDEEFFCKSVTLTAGYISDGYFTFQDTCLDQNLGEALYTNNALAEDNAPPPAAKSIALFNGSLFLADLTFLPEQTFIIPYTAGLITNATDIGFRAQSGGATNASAVVTGLTTSQLKVGMIVIVETAQGSFNAATTWVRIASIDSGSQITLTNTWAGTTAAHTFTFVDSIKIGSKYFPIGYSTLGALQLTANWIRGVADIEVNSTNYKFVPDFTSESPDVTADTLTLESFGSAGLSGTYALQLRGLTQSTSVQIWATHGDQYDPPVPEPTVGTGYTLPQEHIQSGIMWSDKLEPEKFKLQNIEYLGHQLTRIQRLAPIRNAILAFKEDDLFRVSGEGEASGFRFDPHNAGVRLLYPDGLAVLGEKVYAWCDHGIFECDENGALNISDMAIGNQLERLQKTVKAGSITAHGVWACANIKDNEVVFSVPFPNLPTLGYALYVFNVNQGAWTNWFVNRSLNHGIYKADTALLKFQEGDLTWTERAVTADPYTADRGYSITITTVTDSTSIVISGGSGWTPAVGDLISQGSNRIRVATVASSTQFTVEVTGLTAAVATAYVGYASDIVFVAHVAKNPGVLKFWGEGSVWFESIYGLYQYALSFTSSLSSTAVERTTTLEAINTNLGVGETFRFITPKNHARCTRLYPALTINQAGSRWAVSCISVYYRIMGGRVRSR